MKEEVQKAIDLIRPSLQADGGDVELIDVSADGHSKGEVNRRLPWLSNVPDDFKDGNRKND
jgi:Fe-S cluster biogenesis protein NfuA